MNNFKVKELISILKMEQHEVKSFMVERLRSFGYKPVSADGFVYAEGDIKIGLVAHMDTVCTKTPRWINIRNGVLSNGNNKQPLGADDRAGVYAILNLLELGYRPTVILTEDEEIGCVGAEKFEKIDIDHDLMYLIELDRQGSDDAVFYDCGNDDFEDYVTGFGFHYAWGSFSDISVIAPAMGIAAVNLSVGYYRQHTANEFLVLSELITTINKVARMLDDAEYTCTFDFVDRYYSKSYYSKYTDIDEYAYGWRKGYTSCFKSDDDTNTNYGIIIEDSWINYLDEESDFEFSYLDGSEMMYINEDDKIYDVNGVVQNAILFNDQYEQVFYDDFLKKSLKRMGAV